MERWADDPYTLYRLFDMRLELSGKLYDIAQWEEGTRQARHALAMAQEWQDKRREGRALNLLGVNLHRGGQYPEAKPHYERALAISEARLGPDHLHPRTVRSHLARLNR